jgi:5-methyltetrahydropteroyltriglutamate--homocysteine methyltransferase
MPDPRILTTVVGSYPVPDWLRVYPTQQSLRDAIAVVLKTQEDAGIDVVADGELSRFDVNHPETNGMIDYFIGQMGGVATRIGRETLEAFRQDPEMAYRAAPAGVVTGPITEGTLNLPSDARRARALTRSRLKFTVTGPHMLGKVLLDRHYPGRAALADALAAALALQVADIDADVLQVDEANIPGHPEEAAWAAAAINRVLDAAPCEKAVHVCFGNYGGQTVQKGTWEALVPFLSSLKADHLVLEFKRWGLDQAGCLKELPKRTRVGIGVVDIKDNRIETPEEIARDIETATKLLGPDRVACVHPDCGFWMLQRSVADGKIANLVKGRDLFEGR